MTHDIELRGCRPTPLASYLKALGVLRLVAEQKDGEVKGWWRDERFWIRTKLTQDELVAFFLDDYAPSPIIAPWNGGSGFYFQEGKSKDKDPETGKKIKTGVRNQPTEATRTLDIIAAASGRMSAYADLIKSVRLALQDRKIIEAPKEEEKSGLVAMLRSSLPDESLSWLDASIALTGDGARFPPILGTGGNDGNMDFSSNYMQRIAEAMALGGKNRPAERPIVAALFAALTAETSGAAVGQFAPGDAGGPNASSGFEGDARLNPWDFILMLEGALMLSGGVVRRFSAEERSAASFPFTVKSAAAGSGASSQAEEGSARGEFWAPLWNQPGSTKEIGYLFREGRIAQTRRRLRDGVDAALAVASVGADRRVVAFERYGFLQRQGKTFLAAPLGRRLVSASRSAELATDFDVGGWLQKVRRAARDDKAPTRFSGAVRELEDGLVLLAGDSDSRAAAQAVIIAVGRIARILAVSPKLRDKDGPGLDPPPPMRRDWIFACGDDVEIRLAAALASLRIARDAVSTKENDSSGANDADANEPAEADEKRDPRKAQDAFPFRDHVAPLRPARLASRPAWAETGTSVHHVWTEGSLVDSLVAMALRRSMEATRLGLGGAVFAGRPLATLDDVAAFVAGEVDDQRVAELALGFAWIGEKGDVSRPARQGPDRDKDRNAPPLAYAALKPFFHPPETGAGDGEVEASDRLEPLKFPPNVAPLLAAERLADACAAAMERARADGLATPFVEAKPKGDSRRLLAALMFPVSNWAARQCIARAYPSDQDEKERETTDAA